MNPEIDFSKYADGLAPAVIQDAASGRVLMLGFMNRAALDKTLEIGLVTFYSRSRKKLWTKGETSGNFLRVRGVFADCDQDTLLVRALPSGPTCHTGSASCFESGEDITPVPEGNILLELEEVIALRQIKPDKESYTSGLFACGINRIAQKVGEEAIELVIEAKDNDSQKFKSEAADLLFHFLVLLRAKGVGLTEVFDILAARRSSKKS